MNSLSLRLLIEGSNFGAIRALGGVAGEARKTGGALAQMDVAGAGFARTRAGLAVLQTGLSGLRGLAAAAFSFAGGVGGVVSAAGLVAMVKSVADAGDAVAKLSARTSVGIEDLQKLQYAAGLSGASNEALEQSLIRLQRQIVANSKAFARLGVDLRDSAGVTKSTEQVFYEIADRFRDLPDGAEKAALAVELFGRSGADLIPMLNAGSDGLREMGEEAQKLGIIIGADLARQSEQLNDNLTRTGALARGAAVAITADLIPAINDFLQRLLDARNSGTLLRPDQLFGGEDIERSIARIRGQIEALKSGNRFAGGIIAGLFGDPADTLKKLEAGLAYLEKQRDRVSGNAKDSEASQNTLLERRKQLQEAMLRLADLQSARRGEELRDTDRLRSALQSAWQASVDGARAARAEAEKLFSRAEEVAGGTRDKAAQRRTQGLPDGQREAMARRQAESAAGDASFAATRAKLAAMQGDAVAAERLAAEALQKAQRAERFADAIKDDRTASDILDTIAASQEAAIKAQATVKQRQAAALDEQAAAQQQKLTEIEQRMAGLREAAGEIPVDVEIEQALAVIESLKAVIREGETMPIRAVPADTRSMTYQEKLDAIPARGFGGELPGWAPHDRADNVIYRGTPGEFVIQRPTVRQPGAAAFLRDFNLLGMAALRRWRLPGYAFGGELGSRSMVSRLQVPRVSGASISAGAGEPAIFDLGALGKVRARTSTATAADVAAVMRRAAAQFGWR
jgi:hypothetical protein